MNNKLLFFIFTVLILFASSISAFSQNPFEVKIVTLAVSLSNSELIPGATADIEIKVFIEPEYHINSNRPSEEYLIPTALNFEALENVTFGEVLYPKPKMATFSFSEKPISVFEGTLVFRSTLNLSRNISAGKKIIKGTFSFQGCTNVNCFAPQSLSLEIPFNVLSVEKTVDASIEKKAEAKSDTASAIPLSSELETKQIVKQERPKHEIKLTSDEQHAKEVLEKGFFQAILAFFIFGLALNLTPCVYPVIPLTVGYFGGQSDQKKGKAFLVALFYVLGIALIFAALGLISGLFGKQWGFLFQNPWFVVFITVVILAMAASMFGAFEITVPAWLTARLGQSREGNVGALIMGLTVGIVIAPCAAGIIIGLVGLVAKMGIVLKGTILFFIMGLGLGLPYLLLATFSGLLNKLPQSGLWMVWVRKLFGILLIGVALHFFIPQASHIFDEEGFYLGMLALFGGLLLGFLDHAVGYKKGFAIGKKVFGIALMLLGIFFINKAIQSQPSEINWIHYEQGSVAKLKQEGTPVFLDFYAEWCIPCKEMDQKTFRDERVAELAKQFTMIKVDCTAPKATVKEFMNQYKVSGMPTFVFIDKNGNEVKELREIGFVAPDKFLMKMHKLLE